MIGIKPLIVSGHSKVALVAGSIAQALRQNPVILVDAMGAASVNQAVKALAVARKFLSNDGFDLVVRPSLIDREEEGRTITVVQFEVIREESQN